MADYNNITDFTAVTNGDTLIYDYSGTAVSLTLPNGKYRLKCYGAQGGYRSSIGNGGQGGYAEGILILENPTPAFLYVGGSGNTGEQSGAGSPGGGFNGGGSRTNNLPGGGGATDIRLLTDSLLARVIVAGGGGSDGASNKPGGHGGGLTGVSRTDNFGSGGGGGTQTTGGAGGNNNSGSFGTGGAGIFRSSGYGGAGGGGWYGGGGTYPDGSRDDDRGGGGGSGYVLTADSEKPNGYLLGAEYHLTETVLAQGGRESDGLIVIEVIEIGVQKFLARDAEGIKAWHGEITLPEQLTVISEQWNENTGGTTLSSSVSTVSGASVVAVVTTRSGTVFSEGWEILSSELGFSTSNQNLYVLIKTAEGTSESIEVTQTASARIYIQLIAFNKYISFSELWRTSTPGDTVTAFSVSGKQEGDKILWALSANMWNTSGTFGKWNTSPDDLTRYSALTNVQDRQAVFFDDGTGAAAGRSFTATASTGIACIMLRITEFDNNDTGHWETVGDTVSEELFINYGSGSVPQSSVGLLDDAEILLWTDRRNVVENPSGYKLDLSVNATPPAQAIRQTVPFALPEGAAVSRVSLVTDEQAGGSVSGEYAVNGSGIAFTYTLEKPAAGAVAGIKKINIYFTEG